MTRCFFIIPVPFRLSLFVFVTDDELGRLYNSNYTLGHGGSSVAFDGSDQDEVIFPVDFRLEGYIIDSEMHRIMVQPLMSGVRLTVIFDSSHSSTTVELPYICSTQGILKELNLAKEAGSSLLQAISI
jgi:hypothetical protein